MIVQGFDQKTGKTKEFEAPNLDQDALDSLNVSGMSKRQVKHKLDNMNISADARAMLHTLIDVTLKVGKVVIQIGKKIIEFVMDLLKHYPHAGFCMILGLILGTLVASIPAIGFVLGWLVQPLFAALGLAIGWKTDFDDKVLARKIAEVQMTFAPLAE
jgi:ABC-type polysaccharide/polyol phosphate export permease